MTATKIEPVLREVIWCQDGICCERRMWSIALPPFIAYLLPAETTEDMLEAQAFAKDLDDRVAALLLTPPKRIS